VALRLEQQGGMVDFLISNMAPLMFIALVAVLLLGYPVSFSLAFVGLAFALLGIELGLFAPTFLQALPERVWQVASNETLLAIPFFTFMGMVLERSGMAEALLDTAGKLFGPVRGGVAYAVIFVGALLAATTGVVAASVMAMGLISLPIMLRYGYDRRLAAGTIAASGTLAQIIPPSLVLIIMADQLAVPVGDMYTGAIIPGLVLTGLYATYVLGITLLFPYAAPALPPEARSFGPGADYAPVMRAVALPLMLMVWGMVALFAPGIATWMLGQYVPPAQGLLEAGVASEGWRIVILLAGFVLVTVLHRLLLAKAPRLAGQALGYALLAVAAVLAIWTVAGVVMSFSGGLAAGGWGAVSRWAQYGAIIALLGAGSALLRAPDPAVAGAVQKIVSDLLPPLILIFLVLGTIFQGIANSTEGGAMGAVGALALAWSKGRLSLELVRSALDQTARLSAFVIFILIGARVFSLTFYGVDGHKWVEHLLVSLPGGQIGFLVVVNALVFVLAFFLDFFELAFIVVPLLGAAAVTLGIDLVWLGVVLGINMQTSFMHPPFGFALFYLRSVAPTEPYTDKVTGKVMQPVTTAQIYWGAIPFVIIQVIMVGLAIAFPQMVLHSRDKAVDPSAVEITLPPVGGVPDTGAPDLGAPPDFGQPPVIDLSKPPEF
jgi:TRAP-type mannitol/chloroaromatic compound transport system permease large subunit